MEEKNWLKELVENSDFEYFDDDEYLEVVAGQGKRSGSVSSNIGKKPDVMAGQGKESRNNVVYQAVPITAPITAIPVDKRVLQASANPFYNPASYNKISRVFFDIIVEAKQTNVRKQPVVEIPIIYPFMTYKQNYEDVLQRYGLILGDYEISYYNNTCTVVRPEPKLQPVRPPIPVTPIPTEPEPVDLKPTSFSITIKGMSFNLSDLYNAILYRNLKLQINKIRFALQEPDDVAYLNTLTMYSIGITSKVQKDSLNTGSFVRPYNFNNNIVDVDMEIVIDYNNILTYMYDPGLINVNADGDGHNTFRMSFFCNILK